MNEIRISNITKNDVDAKQIRILLTQKSLFYPERPGNPATYDVSIIWKDKAYACTYRIGSKDGKIRSGVLRLQNGLAEVLGNTCGRTFGLSLTGKNEFHLTRFV